MSATVACANHGRSVGSGTIRGPTASARCASTMQLVAGSFGVRGDERRHGEDLARHVRVVGGAAHGAHARGEAGRSRGVEHRRAGGHRLQQHARATASVGEPRRREIDDLDGRGDPLVAAEEVGEHERRAQAHVVVARRIERVAQVSLALGLAGPRLGHAQLEQDPGARARRRRLGQHAAQVAGRGLRARRGAKASRAASVRRATVHASAAGSVASRCSATRSPLSSRTASSSAALRWARMRSAGGTSSRIPARTIGCTKVNGRRGPRMLAATRKSAAVAATSESSPARSAAWASSAVSSTATARASCTATEGRRLRRTSMARPMVRAPSASTRRASAAVGSTPSSCSASTSSRTRKGTPPVVRWQAAAKTGAGTRPRPSSIRRATALADSGAGRTTRASGSASRSPSSGAAAPSASGRVATTSASDSSSRRGSRKARKRREGASAQCASSTVTTSGRSPARFAHSQYRPWSTVKDASGAAT